jgi:hypothetical protein
MNDKVSTSVGFVLDIVADPLNFIGGGLTDNEVTTMSNLVNDYQQALGRYYYLPSGTTEAYDFLERVVASGGTVDDVTSAATITLFTSLVENYLWDKLDVFYPLIGGNANVHMQASGSRFSIANNLIFNGGWTHDSMGITPNGINTYARTSYSPQNTSSGGVNTTLCSLGAYVNETGYDGAIMGAIDAQTDLYQLRIRASAVEIDAQPNTDLASAVGTALTETSGMYIASREFGTSTFVLQNSSDTTLFQNSPASFATGQEVWIGARNYTAAPEYGNKSIAFAYMGRELTLAQANKLREIVQQFQEDLNRNSV